MAMETVYERVEKEGCARQTFVDLESPQLNELFYYRYTHLYAIYALDRAGLMDVDTIAMHLQGWPPLLWEYSERMTMGN